MIPNRPNLLPPGIKPNIFQPPQEQFHQNNNPNNSIVSGFIPSQNLYTSPIIQRNPNIGIQNTPTTISSAPVNNIVNPNNNIINNNNNIPTVTNGAKNIGWIGKLPISVNDETMKEILSVCGELESWKRVENPVQEKLLNFGFCEFKTNDGLKTASKLINKLLIGNTSIIFKHDTTLQNQFSSHLIPNETDLKNKIQSILDQHSSSNVKSVEMEKQKEKEKMLKQEEMLKKKEEMREKEKKRKEKEKIFEIERERRHRKRQKEDRSFSELEKEWISKEKKKQREDRYEDERSDKDKDLRLTLLQDYSSLDERRRKRRIDQKTRQAEKQQDELDRNEILRKEEEEKRKEEERKRKEEERNKQIQIEKETLEKQLLEAEKLKEKLLRGQKKVVGNVNAINPTPPTISFPTQNNLPPPPESFILEPEAKKTLSINFNVNDPSNNNHNDSNSNNNNNDDMDVNENFRVDEENKGETEEHDHPLRKKNLVAPLIFDKKQKEKITQLVIEKVPKDKEQLYAFEIDWVIVESNDIVEGKLKPWISSKIKEFLGGEEPDLVDFVLHLIREKKSPQDIENSPLSEVFESELPDFVFKLWRLFVFEILSVRTILGEIQKK
eukprot:TRINITY_DN1975_c0_g2_i2.p1 TRINITY_DN1975_c0_g2~~TRINITY_DN1975_c0_g2_i2.p1  ORF type:complete len:610 (-),score=268.16 TRINITY_DN1975_c0_g2_i2:13-1842(-)